MSMSVNVVPALSLLRRLSDHVADDIADNRYRAVIHDCHNVRQRGCGGILDENGTLFYLCSSSTSKSRPRIDGSPRREATEPP